MFVPPFKQSSSTDARRRFNTLRLCTLVGDFPEATMLGVRFQIFSDLVQLVVVEQRRSKKGLCCCTFEKTRLLLQARTVMIERSKRERRQPNAAPTRVDARASSDTEARQKTTIAICTPSAGKPVGRVSE